MKEEPPILGHRPSIPLGRPRATEALSPAKLQGSFLLPRMSWGRAAL